MRSMALLLVIILVGMGSHIPPNSSNFNNMKMTQDKYNDGFWNNDAFLAEAYILADKATNNPSKEETKSDVYDDDDGFWKNDEFLAEAFDFADKATNNLKKGREQN